MGEVGALVSQELTLSVTVTGLLFRLVVYPVEDSCVAALNVFPLVAVGTDPLMRGYVVGPRGELWVAWLLDEF